MRTQLKGTTSRTSSKGTQVINRTNYASKSPVLETLNLGIKGSESKKVTKTLVVLTLVNNSQVPNSINFFNTIEIDGEVVYIVGVKVHASLTKEIVGNNEYTPAQLIGVVNDERMDLSGDHWGKIAINEEQYEALVKVAAAQDKPMIGVVRDTSWVKVWKAPSQSLTLEMSLHRYGVDILKVIQ